MTPLHFGSRSARMPRAPGDDTMIMRRISMHATRQLHAGHGFLSADARWLPPVRLIDDYIWMRRMQKRWGAQEMNVTRLCFGLYCRVLFLYGFRRCSDTRGSYRLSALLRWRALFAHIWTLHRALDASLRMTYAVRAISVYRSRDMMIFTHWLVAISLSHQTYVLSFARYRWVEATLARPPYWYGYWTLNISTFIAISYFRREEVTTGSKACRSMPLWASPVHMLRVKFNYDICYHTTRQVRRLARQDIEKLRCAE